MHIPLWYWFSSGLSQVRGPGRLNRQPSRTGLLGPGPGADGPVRRHAGLRPDAGRRHTPFLGECPLHPDPSRPGRGRHHLARRPDQVLRGSGRLGEGDQPGQRDHHHAPGEEGEGDQGGRQHSRPKHHLQDGQGGDENRRRTPGTGTRRPGFTPPFDTDRPEGTLHDGSPS